MLQSKLNSAVTQVAYDYLPPPERFVITMYQNFTLAWKLGASEKLWTREMNPVLILYYCYYTTEGCWLGLNHDKVLGRRLPLVLRNYNTRGFITSLLARGGGKQLAQVQGSACTNIQPGIPRELLALQALVTWLIFLLIPKCRFLHIQHSWLVSQL